MALYTFQAASQVAGGGLRALPGAAVTVLNPGTTVRAAITDVLGNALSNPGLADSYGYFSFVAREGAYDIVATLGSYLIQQTIFVVLAPSMKPIANVDYAASANDGGVVYTALAATRTVTLPPLSTMATGKAFPIADESGSAGAAVQINVVAAPGDLINGAAGTVLTITNPFQPILPVAGTKSWMI